MILYLLIQLFTFLYGVETVTDTAKDFFVFISVVETITEIVVLISFLKERFSR